MLTYSDFGGFYVLAPDAITRATAVNSPESRFDGLVVEGEFFVEVRTLFQEIIDVEFVQLDGAPPRPNWADDHAVTEVSLRLEDGNRRLELFGVEDDDGWPPGLDLHQSAEFVRVRVTGSERENAGRIMSERDEAQRQMSYEEVQEAQDMIEEADYDWDGNRPLMPLERYRVEFWIDDQYRPREVIQRDKFSSPEIGLGV